MIKFIKQESSMNRETTEFKFDDLKFKYSKKESGEMVFTGYASTFGNIDSTNDIMVKGCFDESIKARMPKLCYQHRLDKLIGKFTKVVEDDYGLYVEGKLSNTSLGRDTYELLMDGALDRMSIGFICLDREYKDDLRYIKKVDLWEVSPVTIPANSKAVITSVKSLENEAEIKRDIAHHLKKISFFSRSQADAVAKFALDMLQREAEESKGQIQREAVNAEAIDRAIKAMENASNIIRI